MKVANRNLAELAPYAGNAKKHDSTQIANVAESIKQFGFVQPIVIDRDGVIVIGHCRALAAKAFQAALKGDWKAWELVRDTAGQKPVERVMVADVEPSVIEEVERAVLGE